MLLLVLLILVSLEVSFQLTAHFPELFHYTLSLQKQTHKNCCRWFFTGLMPFTSPKHQRNMIKSTALKKSNLHNHKFPTIKLMNEQHRMVGNYKLIHLFILCNNKEHIKCCSTLVLHNVRIRHKGKMLTVCTLRLQTSSTSCNCF